MAEGTRYKVLEEQMRQQREEHAERMKKFEERLDQLTDHINERDPHVKVGRVPRHLRRKREWRNPTIHWHQTRAAITV